MMYLLIHLPTTQGAALSAISAAIATTARHLTACGLVGLVFITCATTGAMANASEVPQLTTGQSMSQSTAPSTPQEAAPPTSSTPSSDSGNHVVNVTPSATLPSNPEAHSSDRDRVNVKDIYPEYCRAYFPVNGTVSIFDYQEGMLKCKYGVHRH